MTEPNPATDEQLAVIEQPADARTLLVAPAGTGKTFTLIRRIDHLLDAGLAADEVLLLSFSRAVVAELAKRSRSGAGAGRFVRARTFDAWALALLENTYPGEDWKKLDFAERIKEAVGTILDGDAEEYTRKIRHVLLDEIQDLVGDRQEMVEALLSSLDCGFTVVGDPAQAIFNFQASSGHREGDLFAWVRTAYADDLEELALTKDFRARSPRPAGILACGEALRGSTELEDLPGLIRKEFLDTENAGTLDDIIGGFAHQDGTSAILCRDNGQALEVSAALWSKGVGHRLRRRAEDGGSPPWLVDVFDLARGVTIDLSAFVESSGLPQEQAGEVWAELLAITGGRHGRVSTERLRSVLAGGRLTRLPTPSGVDRVTVSSMHGAKGLQYDRVFVLENRTRKDEDAMEEARVLYTAMTRSRDDLYRLDQLPLRGSHRVQISKPASRWGRIDLKVKWARHGMSLENGDVERARPAGTAHFFDDPISLQHYLKNEVRRGDPVTLSRVDGGIDDELPAPMYTIDHRGRPIGVVSESFRRALARYRYGNKKPGDRWPVALVDGWIDDIEAAAGSVASARRAGLNEYGVWLVPRLSGLTWFRWKGDEQDDE
ncbi:UvrD-helicase domain-containing protein [Paractinoplanes maris]|uniref:UvrD-helicase domain-containing protein n=1 Tax=Paractinoplanes maris TaxID=1734446 RepID=UPI0020210679|nr:UvrD-helicase domain-containing protein [Actinoplanes maris]